MQCEYFRDNINWPESKEESFKCDQESSPSSNFNLCIFHDPNYLKEGNNEQIMNNKNHVINELTKKINKDISKSKKVECIGYYLPDLIFPEILNKDSKTIIETTRVDYKFNHAQLSGLAYFYKVPFTGLADFSFVTFLDQADFSFAEFSEANFYNARFSGLANFYESRFSNKANFYSAVFSGLADFHHMRVGGLIDFYYAKFLDQADFSFAEFSEANFSFSLFSNLVYFNNVQFTKLTKFRRTIFEKPEKVFFPDNLVYVSFLKTNITRINFSENTKFSDDKNKLKIIEEIGIEQIINKNKKENTTKPNLENTNDNSKLEEYALILKDVSLESILAIYRNLRENYEYTLRYEEAGQFFIREMELKRKYEVEKITKNIVQKNRGKRNISILKAYSILSEYGENYKRPLFSFISLSAISVISWFWWYQYSYPDHDLLINIKHSLNTTLLDIFQIREDMKLMDIITRVASIPILATLFISLRRKLERKFRH